MTDALLEFCFFTLGLAILASGYRALISFLPDPVYVIPGRAAVHLIFLFWALAALSFVAWYMGPEDTVSRNGRLLRGECPDPSRELPAVCPPREGPPRP